MAPTLVMRMARSFLSWASPQLGTFLFTMPSTKRHSLGHDTNFSFSSFSPLFFRNSHVHFQSTSPHDILTRRYPSSALVPRLAPPIAFWFLPAPESTNSASLGWPASTPSTTLPALVPRLSLQVPIGSCSHSISKRSSLLGASLFSVLSQRCRFQRRIRVAGNAKVSYGVQIIASSSC